MISFMMRNFSAMLLRPRSALEFLHGQDPLQTKTTCQTPPKFCGAAGCSRGLMVPFFGCTGEGLTTPQPPARGSGKGIVPTEDGDEHTEGARDGHDPRIVRRCA